MNADAPQAPIVKFGMATDVSDRMVDRHFEVMDERDQIAAGVMDHNLRTACIAKAVLDGTPTPPMPFAAPDVEPPPEVAPPAVVVTPRARPDNLRERLGLT